MKKKTRGSAPRSDSRPYQSPPSKASRRALSPQASPALAPHPAAPGHQPHWRTFRYGWVGGLRDGWWAAEHPPVLRCQGREELGDQGPSFLCGLCPGQRPWRWTPWELWASPEAKRSLWCGPVVQ